MTVHARSDVSGVSISVAHGGCGETHSRPVNDGVPEKTWSLSCPQCEEFLRFDPCWSAIHDSVPETPDEVTAREENKKRSDADTQHMTAKAVAVLPEILSQMVAGNAELMKQFLQLAASKGNLPESIGSSVKGEVLGRAREVEASDGLTSLSVAELRAVAKARGIAVPVDKRDKSSIINLLRTS